MYNTDFSINFPIYIDTCTQVICIMRWKIGVKRRTLERGLRMFLSFVGESFIIIIFLYTTQYMQDSTIYNKMLFSIYCSLFRAHKHTHKKRMKYYLKSIHDWDCMFSKGFFYIQWNRIYIAYSFFFIYFLLFMYIYHKIKYKTLNNVLYFCNSMFLLFFMCKIRNLYFIWIEFTRILNFIYKYEWII